MKICSRCGGSHNRRDEQEYCRSCEAFLRKAKQNARRFSPESLYASAVFRKAARAAEVMAQHGQVKHWRRNEAGELVLVSE